MTFALEALAQARTEMEALHAAHWQETGTGALFSSRNFAWNAYFGMEHAGILQTVTARDGKRLSGYCLSVVLPHLHSGELTAMTDNFYLEPSARKGRNGIELLKAAEGFWRARGVKVGLITTKVQLDHGRILGYLGYRPHETVYAKRLEGAWEL